MLGCEHPSGELVMTKKFTPELCPVCGEGTWQPYTDGVYTFRHGRKEHKVVGQNYARCDHCDTRGYLPGQRDENRRIVREYQAKLTGYVSPSDVLAVREKYLLTQADAARIFGGGIQGFSKWERGIASPAGPTARLIKLALKHPEVMCDLARDVGINLVTPSPKEKVVVRVVQVFVESVKDDFLDCSSEFDESIDQWQIQEKPQTKNRAYLN